MFACLLCLSTTGCWHRHTCLCGCPSPAMPRGDTGTFIHSPTMFQCCLLSPLLSNTAAPWQHAYAYSHLLWSGTTTWQCRHTGLLLLCPSTATWLCRHACSHAYCVPVPKHGGVGKAIHTSARFHVVTQDYLLAYPLCSRTAIR